MSPLEASLLVVLGIFVVLLPIGIVGLTTSKLDPRTRTGYFVVYGVALFVLATMVADVSGTLAGRPIVDFVLIAGGVFLGISVDKLLLHSLARRHP